IGFISPTVISVVGGSYAISTDNGGSWSGWNSADGIITPNSQVKVRLTSSANPATSSNATLTIGGISTAFTVTTAHRLNVTVISSGTATGTVTGNVGGFSCTSGTCPLITDTAVTLHATPSGISLFDVWTGDGICSSSTTDCGPLSMNQNREITATFSNASKVKIGSAAYNDIQTAYDTLTATGAEIWLLNDTEVGRFTANSASAVAVTLRGGFDALFGSNSGTATSTITSPLQISKGMVTIDKVIVK
ncbi:MAG: hypothetical protein J0653_07160, partial [Deltaproteobacteria bacterium]|nr:hypothetical protein [Deltaproteobacteria bacterium]